MSRFIDKYPAPKAPTPVEVVVISMGRTGTLSLFYALDILGYKTYHLAHLFAVHGTPHIKMMADGMRANVHGEGELLTRKDFDKWFVGYNALTDVPGYFLEEMIASYPEAKFILTTRDSDAWLRSMNKTLRERFLTVRSPWFNFMAFFSAYHKGMKDVVTLMSEYVWDKKPLDDDEAAKEVFIRHNALAQKLLPPEKLLVLKMEDGLGWEKICDFLGKDVPDKPYPHTNTVQEFRSLVTKVTRINTALFLGKALLYTAPVVGGAVWYFKFRK